MHVLHRNKQSLVISENNYRETVLLFDFVCTYNIYVRTNVYDHYILVSFASFVLLNPIAIKNRPVFRIMWHCGNDSMLGRFNYILCDHWAACIAFGFNLWYQFRRDCYCYFWLWFVFQLLEAKAYWFYTVEIQTGQNENYHMWEEVFLRKR